MSIKTVKVLAVILLTVFIIGTVQANLIAEIAMDGVLSFLDPTLQTIIQGVMCTTNPAGALVCLEQYLQGKIIGFVSGKVMEQISKISPEVYKAITTYNTIKGYIDKGASILNELKINEKGQIEEGSISFGEDEYSILELFSNATAEDIVVSNAEYDFKTKELFINEGGFLKIKVKDENGEIRELNYENIKKDGYFKINGEGFVEEAIFVSSDEAEYTFGNYEPIKVSADTSIQYMDGKLGVFGKDKNFLYGNLNMSIFGDFIKFSENDIICSDCLIDDVRLKGTIRGLVGTINEAGILEKTDKGYLIKNGEVIYKQNLLIVDGIMGQTLIANSDADLSDYGENWLRQTANVLEMKSSKGGIDLEILEGHDIFNTDAEDLLRMTVMKGDGLKIEKRADDGLTPKAIYKSSENGATHIKNDGIDPVLDKESVQINPPGFIKTLVSPDEKSQSVAFELEFDSGPMKDKKLRMNSYNQFVVLSKDDEEIVSYNKFDLPVSASIEDNSLQRIEQLRKKYPGVKFEVEKRYEYSKGELEFVFDEEYFPPYYLYLTDNFFQEYPGALDDIGGIVYASRGLGASAMLNGFMTSKEDIRLGAAVDPYDTGRWTGKVLLPMQTMVHEWEHVKDNLIGKEEFALFSDAQKSKKLSEIYNKIVRDAKDKLSKNQEFKEEFQRLYESSEKDYVKSSLSSLIKSKYNKDIFSYIKEDLGNAELRDKTNEEILREYEKNPNEINGFIISKLSSLYKPEEELTSDERKEWNQISSVKEVNDVGKEVLTKWNALDIDKYIKSAYFGKQAKVVDDIININSGLPYSYSLKNYAEGISEAYLEVSSTYQEQSIETRRVLVQSGNKVVSDTYKKLTQIAFDSGKMPLEEYKAIMGDGFCKKADCSDKICVEYKLLCCRKNYFSPNC